MDPATEGNNLSLVWSVFYSLPGAHSYEPETVSRESVPPAAESDD